MLAKNNQGLKRKRKYSSSEAAPGEGSRRQRLLAGESILGEWWFPEEDIREARRSLQVMVATSHEDCRDEETQDQLHRLQS